MSLRSDYVGAYGNEPPGPNASQEQQDAWGGLPDQAKEAIKNLVPVFQGMSEEQQGMFNDLIADIEAGSPVDTERLATLIGEASITPRVRDWFTRQVGDLLLGRNVPDFQEVFNAQRRALGVSLDEKVQQIQDQAARRGVLGSSSTAAGIGGAIGGYSQSIATLISDIADRQERVRATRFQQGLDLGAFGLEWQQQGISNEFALLQTEHALYLDDIALQQQGLDYLTNQQILENQFNLGVGQQFGYDPLTGADFIGAAVGTGLSAITAFG